MKKVTVIKPISLKRVSKKSIPYKDIPAVKITFNHIHKRFMVVYHLADMRRVWTKVRSDFKKDHGEILPKRFGKYPQLWTKLNEWIETKIQCFVLEGGEDVTFYNKSDLKVRGWDDKLINKLYPTPDKIIYLGRGRYAYYYNGTKLYELEDGDEFLEYISAKLERQRKRESAKVKKLNGALGTGFGSEFVG
jgi:hypothetical protein